MVPIRFERSTPTGGLALALAVLVSLAGCGEGSVEPGSEPSPQAIEGRQAYLSLGCAPCHGESLEGKRSAPRLAELAGRWTQESLVEYLKDPDAVIQSTPRLAYYAEQYPISMPAFEDRADEETLQAIAAYLLSQ